MQLTKGLRAVTGLGAVVGLALVTACATAHLKPIPPRGPIPVGAGIAIDTAPVPLDPADPTRQAVDGFRYLGGLALTSDATSRLHGLSDLTIAADGALIAPSDDGDILRARIPFGPDGRLAGITDATLEPLRNAAGEALQGKSEGDAEGLTQLPGGPMLVSFERDHRIWAYDAAGKPTPAPMPNAAFAENDGMEGLAPFGPADPEAYWVGGEPGDIWLCRLAAACEAVAGLPKPPAGFRLSGLATGPGGELVILHHSFIPAIGSRIILTVVRDPRGAKTVLGRMSMGPNSTVDNFEGVAVQPGPDGGWRLLLLSDDNFNPKQRTLLLAFAWTPPS